jgi:hypothetical protein
MVMAGMMLDGLQPGLPLRPGKTAQEHCQYAGPTPAFQGIPK